MVLLISLISFHIYFRFPILDHSHLEDYTTIYAIIVFFSILEENALLYCGGKGGGKVVLHLSHSGVLLEFFFYGVI